MSTDPTPCNSGLLADIAAGAMQTYNIVDPYPVFMTAGQCSGQSFPMYYFPMNCTSTTLPAPNDNCLRVIDNLDGTFNPLGGGTVRPDQVNRLPTGGTNPFNVFQGPDERMYSWYIPVNYRVVFYVGDPSVTPRSTLAASKQYLDTATIQYTNNAGLMTDACLENLFLADNVTQFMPPTNPTSADCRLAVCACGTGKTYPAGTPYCNQSTAAVGCPGVNHAAPYFLLIKNYEFSDEILDMCVHGSQKVIGTTSLNYVWQSHTLGCDNYVSAFCGLNDVTKTEYAEMCSCFTQQQALNQQYGSSIQVPVCCFGQDPSGDLNKSCYFDDNAYKTGAMSRNCCSFAICQQVVHDTPGIQDNTTTPGQVICNNTFVNFPVVSPQSSVVFPATYVDVSDSIPFYTWVIFAIAIVLILVFVLVLLFV